MPSRKPNLSPTLEALVCETLEALNAPRGISADRNAFMKEMQLMTNRILTGASHKESAVGDADLSSSGNNTSPPHGGSSGLLPHQPELVKPAPTDRVGRLQALRDLRELHVDSFRRLEASSSPLEDPSSIPESLHTRTGTAAANGERQSKFDVAQSHDFSRGKGLLWTS